MINSIYFILDYTLPTRGLAPPEENIYYSIQADPLVKGSLEDTYAIMEDPRPLSLALTLKIQSPLTPENLRAITSFLFLPGYLRIKGRPVIILFGKDLDFLELTAGSLSDYLSQQGFQALFIHTLTSGMTCSSAEKLAANYTSMIGSDPGYGSVLFFYATSADSLHDTLTLLQQADKTLQQQYPRFCSLVNDYGKLEKKYLSLQSRSDALEKELHHQEQYIDVLRAGHAAKEIQDFYTREYEILPLWYKRFGHILKVMTGKRTFRSLFRKDVKKYKD